MKTLLRYNVRILLGNTVWLIVVPIASSQLLVVWNMAVANTFNEVVAAKTSELLGALWAALLCAHTLGQEYRSQLAEITFSKPLSVNRIVLLRLAAMFAFVLLLTAATLGAYFLWLQPFPFVPVLLAGVPSMLFLGMVALVLTALWRNPLMGFGGAALYWALDWMNGMALNPLLSLHSFAESLPPTVNPLAEHWRINKIILLIVAVLLYLLHGRMVERPTGQRTWRTMVKSVGVPVGLFLLCLFSGALYKIYVGVRQEAQFPERAWLWYYSQFRVYNPFPAVWMFGPAFAYYADQPFPGEKMRNRFPDVPSHMGMRMTRWQTVVSRYPDSRWVDHALYELGKACEAFGTLNLSQSARPQNGVENPTAYKQKAADCYEALARKYPKSPFAPPALSRLNTVAEQLNRPRQQRWAQNTLVERYSDHPRAWHAARQLAEQWEREGRLSEMLPLMRRIADRAPVTTQPTALLFLAQKFSEMKQPQEARQFYQRALTAARAGIAAVQRGEEPLTPKEMRNVLTEMESVVREAQKALEG